MTIGNGVKASFDLRITVVGIAYWATCIWKFECNLATGICFSGKTGGISHQIVNTSLAAESICENSQGIFIATWAPTSRRARRWIASIRVAFGAADIWELATSDKPACIFIRRVVREFVLQQPSDTSTTRVVLGVEIPNILGTFRTPTVRRVFVAGCSSTTASWITRTADVWELDPGDTTTCVLLSRISVRPCSLQIFDACTTFEISSVSFPNGIGTTRATAFSSLLGLLVATVFTLTAEMA
jgi:hypothetical protein